MGGGFIHYRVATPPTLFTKCAYFQAISGIFDVVIITFGYFGYVWGFTDPPPPCGKVKGLLEGVSRGFILTRFATPPPLFLGIITLFLICGGGSFTSSMVPRIVDLS